MQVAVGGGSSGGWGVQTRIGLGRGFRRFRVQRFGVLTGFKAFKGFGGLGFWASDYLSKSSQNPAYIPNYSNSPMP